MADKAFMVLADGSLSAEPIEARNLRPGDFNKRFKCCGFGCEAEMVAVHGSHSNYFREYSKLRTQHTFLCPFNEEGATKKVAHLDRQGSSIILKDLFERFGNFTHRGKKDPNGNEPTGDIDPVGGRRTGIKPIERCSRSPRDLAELYCLLATSETDDTYANQKVRDILLDRRSIENYRKKKLSDGQCVITLCHKMDYRKFDLDSPHWNTVILCDAFYYTERTSPIFFRVNTTPEGWNQIIHCDKKSIIAICSCWHPYNDSANEYESELVMPGQILILDSSKVY
jgi:hypothetical protein